MSAKYRGTEWVSPAGNLYLLLHVNGDPDSPDTVFLERKHGKGSICMAPEELTGDAGWRLATSADLKHVRRRIEVNEYAFVQYENDSRIEVRRHDQHAYWIEKYNAVLAMMLELEDLRQKETSAKKVIHTGLDLMGPPEEWEDEARQWFPEPCEKCEHQDCDHVRAIDAAAKLFRIEHGR